MQHLRKNLTGGVTIQVVAMSLMLGACSVGGFSDVFSKPPELPKLDMELNPFSRVTSATAPGATRIVVTPADFVNADGSCAGQSSDSNTGNPVPTGIALEMTECGMVQLLGPPEKLDVGANERGERSVTMLYSKGERPGLYTFTRGQLTAMDRVEPPPPPPKPKKPAKPPAKKPVRPAT
jgi:hypothetical protein